MTPEQRHQIYGDRYATATASAQSTAPADPARRHHRRSVAALSGGIAAAHAPSANPAANYGAPASAATPIANPEHRHIHGQPGGAQNRAATVLPQASVAATAGTSAAAASAATASATDPGERGASANNTTVKPQGKVIAASVAFLIALVVLLAAARNSVVGRPRRR